MVNCLRKQGLFFNNLSLGIKNTRWGSYLELPHLSSISYGKAQVNGYFAKNFRFSYVHRNGPNFLGTIPS